MPAVSDDFPPLFSVLTLWPLSGPLPRSGLYAPRQLVPHHSPLEIHPTPGILALFSTMGVRSACIWLAGLASCLPPAFELGRLLLAHVRGSVPAQHLTAQLWTEGHRYRFICFLEHAGWSLPLIPRVSLCPPLHRRVLI